MCTIRKLFFALAALAVAAIPTPSDAAPRTKPRRPAVPSVQPPGLGPSLGAPSDIAVDGTGMLSITDTGMSAVLSIDPATGNRTLVSDNVQGSGPQLAEIFPTESRSRLAIAVDATGARFVVSNGLLVRVDTATGNRTVLSEFGGGKGTGPSFWFPAGAVVESGGTVLVVAASYGGVVRVDPGTGNRTLMSGCDTYATSCVPKGSGPLLLSPAGAVRGDDGALFLASEQAVLRVDPVTGDRTVVADGTTGTGPALPPAEGLAREASGDFIWASLTGLYRIDAVSGDRVLLSGGAVGAGFPFRWIQGVAVEPTGALVVADADLGAVVRVDAKTGDRTILSGGPSGRGPRITACIKGAAREASGTLVIANCDQGVVRVDPATGDRSIVSGPGVGSGPAFTRVLDVAVEATGTILVADKLSLKRVRPRTGARSVVADGSTGSAFLDATGVLVEPEGTALVMDSGFTEYLPVGLGIPVQTRAALRRVDVGTGSSEVVSGEGLLGGGVGRGPRFFAPVDAIGYDPRGTVAVAILDNLLEVDLATGRRRHVQRAADSPTPVFEPSDVAVAADGSWLATERWGGRLKRVDPATGFATTVSSGRVGSGPLMGQQLALVIEPGGTVLVVFASGVTISRPEPVVLVVRIDPTTGNRTVLSRY